MKNYNIFICLMLLHIIILFWGCSQNQTYANKNVILAQYDNIEIDKNHIIITDEEINSIITLDLSFNEYYKRTNKNTVEMDDIILLSINCEDNLYNINNEYIVVGQEELNADIDSFLVGKKVGNTYNLITLFDGKNLNLSLTLHGIYTYFDVYDKEPLCNFYGQNTIEDVYIFLRNRAQNEIIFDYMWKTILAGSRIISYPENMIKQMQLCADTYDSSVKTNDALAYYTEILIAEAILEKEDKCISKVLLDNKLNEISNKYNITLEEVQDYFSEQDIYYLTLMDEVKKILVSKAIIK